MKTSQHRSRSGHGSTEDEDVSLSEQGETGEALQERGNQAAAEALAQTELAEPEAKLDAVAQSTGEGSDALLHLLAHPAGDRADAFQEIATQADVPEHYTSDPRFTELSSDPAHGDAQGPGSLREAMAGLEAEDLGILRPPIRRGPAEIEFYDSEGRPIDVKAPPSPPEGARWSFSIEKNVDSVLRQVRKKANNGITGESEYIHVLLDTTYMTPEDLQAFHDALVQRASASELERIIQVNVRL